MARRAIPWTADEDATLIQMQAAGKTWDEISRVVTTHSSESARSRFMRVSTGVAAPRTPIIEPIEKEAMAASSVHSQMQQMQKEMAELRAAKEPQRVPVQAAITDRLTVAERWSHAEIENRRRIEEFEKRSRFSVDFSDTDPGLPIAITFVSDQHISINNCVALDRMRYDAELIAKTPGLYAAIGGDGVDNHIVIRSASLAARSQPSDQWDFYEYYLGIFAHKILALISGNHDAWTDQVAGVDMVAQIAQRQKLCYCPSEAILDMTHEGQAYNVVWRHQFTLNSRFNQGHAVKQLYRMGENLFDVGCVCHHHEPHCESFEAHGETRWALRPGSYQRGSSYTRQYGWSMTMPTCPTVVFWPGRRHMVGFRNLPDAVFHLNAARGGK